MAALCRAMRQGQGRPTGVVCDQRGVLRGPWLEAFCRHLGSRRIPATPQHPHTNGTLERVCRDDMPACERQQPTGALEALRRALPASMHDRNEVRGHRALPGRPAMTRLAEQHRMAVPWVGDTLAQ